MSERREFKVGDRVRIRDWDDMVREFGEPDSDGDIKITIPCEFNNITRPYTTWFLEEMRGCCGRVATVGKTGLTFWENIEEYGLLSEAGHSSISDYTFISEMLIPLDDPSPAPRRQNPVRGDVRINLTRKE